jgi:hypothetical protein
MSEILTSAIAAFAFHPIRCAIVAAMLTVPVLVPEWPTPIKVVIGLAALSWWAFCWLEATTPPRSNIRVDLIILGPYFLGIALVGIGGVLAGVRSSRKRTAKGINDD